MNGIELDLHLSCDRQAVVHHDETLVRCTDDPLTLVAQSIWRIDHFDLAPLATLEATCAFRSPKPEGPYHVPSLDEVLVLLVPRGALIDLELKTRSHVHEVRVVPWTINDPEHQSKLIQLGIDAICTDDPAALVARLRALIA